MKKTVTVVLATMLALMTTVVPLTAFAEDVDAKLLFEQTCRQLAEENWLPEDYEVKEYAETKQYSAKYQVISEDAYLDLIVDKENKPERFAFQMKPDQDLEEQITPVLRAVFSDMEHSDEFAKGLVESYTASMKLSKENPYAQKWYNQQRCELDTGWMYIWIK